MPFRYVVMTGSARTDRQGLKVGRFFERELKARGHEVTVIDPALQPLPLLDKMHMDFEPGTAPPDMEAIHQALAAADGFVVIGAEYNHSVPPALKNLLDHYQREFYFKPGGVVTYSSGPFGGVRLAPHMRAILGELGMVTPSVMFAVSKVRKAFDDDGTALDENYPRRVQRFLDELDWYTGALKAKRDADGTPF